MFLCADCQITSFAYFLLRLFFYLFQSLIKWRGSPFGIYVANHVGSLVVGVLTAFFFYVVFHLDITRFSIFSVIASGFI